MAKLWEGKFHNALDSKADDFNSSISVDSKMYKEDILGSLAHAEMLGKNGIINDKEYKEIADGLKEILEDIEIGALEIDENAEDIHSFIEGELTSRIGASGKKLHTARSRNDQVALDTRLYIRTKTQDLIKSLKIFVDTLIKKAEDNIDVIMPGYTHLQKAQPILFSQHIMAYVSMFLRDIGRLSDALSRMNECPLGSAALAGTTYNIDRDFVAKKLNFDCPTLNSMDGVADRDYCVELESAFAIIMMHLSRLSEEIILWSSQEFSYVRLSDAFTTGSSIMPQKKNPDICELVRGKTGRVYGDLFQILTTLKGLPLAYNKDMQEDKEGLFDAVDTVSKCIEVYIPMIETMALNKEKMLLSCKNGFINATDLADYLTKKGMPFRDAYKLTGDIVAYCTAKNISLDDMELKEYKLFGDIFEDDLYDEINIKTCVEKRISEGGTGTQSVLAEIEKAKKKL